MSCRFILLLCAGILGAATVRAELRFATLAVGATTYTNVTVLDASATDLLIRHREGMANVKLRELPAELQERFRYDALRAESAERQQDADTRIYQQSVSQRVWDRIAEQKAASAAAEASAAYKFADAIDPKSLLDQPAPPLALTEWFTEKPEPGGGKATLVFFWNSQSEPCRRVIPELNALQAKFTNDLAVIGVTTETAAQVEQMTQPKIEFLQGRDSKSAVAKAAGVSSVPCVLLVDREGIVRYQGHPAAVTADALQVLLAK